jgi:hypothetical protein
LSRCQKRLERVFLNGATSGPVSLVHGTCDGRLMYISLSPFFLVAFPLFFRNSEIAREIGEEESESLQADMVGGKKARSIQVVFFFGMLFYAVAPI